MPQHNFPILTKKHDLNSKLAQQFKDKFQFVLEKPQNDTYKFLVRQKYIQGYSYTMRSAILKLRELNQLEDIMTDKVQQKIDSIRSNIEENDYINYQKLKKKEPMIRNVVDLMDVNYYANEHKYYSEEFKRIKRDAEYQSWMHCNDAALSIQKVFRGVTEKDFLFKFLEDKYQIDMQEPTLFLQSVFRQMKCMKVAKEHYLKKQLRNKILQIIIGLQARVRQKHAEREAKLLYLVQIIEKHRNAAAVMIQKHYKRYMIQQLYHKVLDLEDNYVALKWTGQRNDRKIAKKVQVVGSFTNPPWEKKVDLDFCPLRQIFVKYMSNLQEGIYLMKYLVDGEFRCEKTLPSATDSIGHLNNILEIFYDGGVLDEFMEAHPLEDDFICYEPINLSINKDLERLAKVKKGGISRRSGSLIKAKTKRMKNLNHFKLNIEEKKSADSTTRKNPYVDQFYHLEDFDLPQKEVKKMSVKSSVSVSQDDGDKIEFNKISPIHSDEQQKELIEDFNPDEIEEYEHISYQYSSRKEELPRIPQLVDKEEEKMPNTQYDVLYQRRPKAKNRLISFDDFYGDEQAYGQSTQRETYDPYQMGNTGFSTYRTDNQYSTAGVASGTIGMRTDYDDYYAMYYYNDPGMSTTLSANNLPNQTQDNQLNTKQVQSNKDEEIDAKEEEKIDTPPDS